MNLAKKVLLKMIKGYRNIYARSIQKSFIPEEQPEKTKLIKEKEIVEKTLEVKPQISAQPLEVPAIVKPQLEGIAEVEIPTVVKPQIKVESAEIPIKILPVIYEGAKGKMEMEEYGLVKELKEGVEIPNIVVPSSVKPSVEEEEEKHFIQMVYPLIPKKPKPNEPVFAYAKIYWDAKEKRYFYEVVEPKISDKLKNIMGKIKELLEQRLDVDFSKLKKIEASEYIHNQIKEIINYFGFNLTETEKLILKYYVERDFIGLGKIEPFMQDDQLEDISCDGLDIPIFVFHRNPALGSLVTNVKFSDPEELDSFIIRLAQISGKSISVAEPLVDATLPDGSRIQATLATDIARKGSNFTIRKFYEKPLTPTDILNYGTIDARTLAFLWLAVDYGRSILVSGGTASGKTTFLNILSLFIRPEKKIISIEDTAELQLPHEHWVPTVARTSISTESPRAGEIDMFELLRESLRQRPDYIIVGEVRGKEAFILFQQMATGHPSLATIHAENLPKLIDRLTTPPISLHPSLIINADIIVFMSLVRYRDKHVRKVTEILELVGFDRDRNTPIANRIFKWNPIDDKFEPTGKSLVLKKISDLLGIKTEDLIEELKRRTIVLSWMQERNINNYKDVFKILNEYYSSPSRLMERILGEI